MEMRAAAFDQFGGPEVIEVTQLPVPDLGPGEILIEVSVAGVGQWDPELVSGSFSDTEVKFPRVIGSDGAGRVRAIGANVKKFKVGDRVYAWGFGNPKGGFFAEYAVVSQNDAALIPPTISLEEAGVLAVDGLTALEGLEKVELKKRHSIIIFGANGGVGHLALQLAKVIGAQVFAVASGQDGVELVLSLGADAAAEGRSARLPQLLERFAPATGCDAALVFAGGNGWELELAGMKKKGRVAFPNGVEPEPLPPPGVKLRGYDGEKSPEAFERLNRLIAKGPFRVVVSKTYPLEQAAQALRDVRRHHLGKLAIQVKRA